jgi:membrane protein required for colicin V production
VNGFDVTLLVVAGILVAVGLIKGLVRILIGLGGLVAAFALAARLHEPVAARLGWIDAPDEARMLVAWVAIFVGVLLFGGILAYLARKLVKAATLGWADRLAGGAVGLVAAFLAAALVVLPVVAYSPWSGELLRRSTLAPYVVAGADLAVSLAPEKLTARYETRMEELRRAWRSDWFNDSV